MLGTPHTLLPGHFVAKQAPRYSNQKPNIAENCLERSKMHNRHPLPKHFPHRRNEVVVVGQVNDLRFF
jgi:hypothetical protein